MLFYPAAQSVWLISETFRWMLKKHRHMFNLSRYQKVNERKRNWMNERTFFEGPCVDGVLFFSCSQDYPGSCIDAHLRCNGRSECPNGDDEFHCRCKKKNFHFDKTFSIENFRFSATNPAGTSILVIILAVLAFLFLLCILSTGKRRRKNFRSFLKFPFSFDLLFLSCGIQCDFSTFSNEETKWNDRKWVKSMFVLFVRFFILFSSCRRRRDNHRWRRGSYQRINRSDSNVGCCSTGFIERTNSVDDRFNKTDLSSIGIDCRQINRDALSIGLRYFFFIFVFCVFVRFAR